MKRKLLNHSLSLTFALLLLFNGLFLWYNRGNASGFFFERIGYLATNIGDGAGILPAYTNFPFAQFFLSIVSIVTGLDIINVVFLPIIPIFAFFPILLISGCFFNSKKYALLISISIFLSIFALYPHFLEYEFGKLVFLFFVYSLIKYSISTDHKSMFAGLTILFFIGTKFFAPPMEIWAISIVFFLTLVLLIVRFFRYNNFPTENVKIKLPWYLMILFIVIFFAYNPKFYNDFLTGWSISSSGFSSDIQYFVWNIFNPSLKPSGEFVATSSSPMLLRIIHTLYYFFITLPIFIKIIYELKKNKNSRFWAKNAKEIFSLSLILAFMPEFVLYGLIGFGVSVRYLLLIFPLISAYYIKSISKKKVFVVFLVILISLTGCSYLLQINNESQRPFAGEDHMIPMISLLEGKTARGIDIMVDHHTYGSIKASFGKMYRDPTYFNFKSYDCDRYNKIIGINKEDTFEFDYLVVNLETLNRNIRQGPPLWKSFEALDVYYPMVAVNQRLNKIYESQKFDIYKDNFVEDILKKEE